MAKVYDSSKILQGPAYVFIGNSGEDGYTEVGWTRDGVSISKSRDTRDVPADQSFHPLDISVTAEGFEISFKLLQATYANLCSIWGEPGRTKGTKGVLGISSAEDITYRKIKVTAYRKDKKLITIEFTKCLQTGFEALPLVKDGEALIGATFRVLWDDNEGCVGYFDPATEED